MAQKTILHVCVLDKFIPPFVDFVKTHFEFEKHLFIVMGDIKKHPIALRENVIYIENVKSLILIKALYRSDKIILHGLFDYRAVVLLSLQPWLLKKCYWIMWGGDLYRYQFRRRNLKNNIYEQIRAFVIRRVGHFVTYVKGDYELAQKWYGAKGQWHECFMYPSNLYKDYAVPPKQGDTINILVGNSADPSNNHVEILEKLKGYKEQNIQIYCPLSYGPAEYAERITKLGNELFGAKFTPLLDFMPFNKYLELLGQIEIAVFAHKRQQGMGNTTTLLGLGKKVYMRTEIVTWGALRQLGLHVYDVGSINLSPLPDERAIENRQIISEVFSESNLILQLSKIFDADSSSRCNS